MSRVELKLKKKRGHFSTTSVSLSRHRIVYLGRFVVSVIFFFFLEIACNPDRIIYQLLLSTLCFGRPVMREEEALKTENR